MLKSTRDPAFLTGLLSFTLAVRPSRGRLTDFTVEHGGPHRGKLDLKRGGLWPVVLLGRWLALVLGDPSGSTADRIRRGSQSGLLSASEADGLIGAFEMIYQLRFDLEIAALKSGTTSDSYVAPGAIDTLRRHYLHDSFRAIAEVQTAVRKAWASGRTRRLDLA
jgi:CBS domain-containing protein